MKTIFILIFMYFLFSPDGHTQSNNRIFTLEQFENGSWSVYVKFQGAKAQNFSHSKYGDGVRIRNSLKLNDKLYLQIYSKPTQTDNAVPGYYFSLSKDPKGNIEIKTTSEPKRGMRADSVYAFHFRNSDNTGLNRSDSKNVNAPGAIRVVQYEGYTITIRLLKANITNLGKGNIPMFSKAAFLLTIRPQKKL